MKDTTRDYTIAQFKNYAALGCPNKIQVIADTQMSRALKLDLIAVIDTLQTLTNSGKDYISRAIYAVYFASPKSEWKKGEINARVLCYAIDNYTDERTVWRWLREARLLCAEFRGLNTGTMHKASCQ